MKIWKSILNNFYTYVIKGQWKLWMVLKGMELAIILASLVLA
jgi:hypothetical protein